MVVRFKGAKRWVIWQKKTKVMVICIVIHRSGVTRVDYPAPGGKKEFCAPAFTSNFAQMIKITVKFGVSFELLINGSLEKNNEGERLTC